MTDLTATSTETVSKKTKAQTEIVLCKLTNCERPAALIDKSDYCKKHKLQEFVDETTAEGKRTCVNYIRNCREKLDNDYKFSRCQNCLAKDREKDKAKRDAAKEKLKELEESSQNSSEKITEKPCTVCCKIKPMEEFVGSRNEVTKQCQTCRNANKREDARRDKQHCNALARENSKKPERIAVKAEWKENNYEKVAKMWINYRQRKIESLGIDEYHRINAENAKKWRDSNIEKVENNKLNNKKSLTIQYSTYKSSALAKNLVFEITQEQYNEIVKPKCYYCDCIHERGFNGIDRIDSTKGYVLDNCVSCCKMCNYMKKSLDEHIFIKRAEHITSYNNLTENKNYHDDVFNNYLYGVTYSTYKYTASRKDYVFEITKEQFNEITDKDCYLCGKKTVTYIHRNGIDRIDNNVGYVFENCRPCCGECNFMKRQYKHQDVLNKFKQIYEKHSKTTLKNENNVGGNTVHIVRNANKQTREQIAQKATIRKQKQRELLKEKYGNEEYKKMHAEQIAKTRAKKRLLMSQENNEN